MPKDAAFNALMSARDSGVGMQEADPEMSMPMGQDKSTKTMFLDRSIFGSEKVKMGDAVVVRGTVTSIGSTIGFSPTEGMKEDSGDKPEEEESFDEDLDDHMAGT